MKTENFDFSPEAGFGTIQEMIATAKRSFSKISFYFLLWGILMGAAALAEFALAIQGYGKPYIVWPIAGALGGVVAAVYGARQGKQSAVVTFADKVIMYLWGSYTLSLVLVIVGSVITGVNPSKFVLLLTGLPTFATGALLRFCPLMAGGIVFWSFGLASFLIPSVYAPLLFSIAMAIGYIFPGIVLKRANL